MRRLLPLVLLAGCRFDATLPKNLVIECGSDAECPTDYRCEPSVSLCWSTKSDGVAPQVDFHALTPARARVGTKLSLAVTASELLSAAPDAVLKSGATQVGAFTVVSAAAPSYAFEYVALGTEPEVDVSVFATLVDVSGTVAAPAELGQVRFDFTPPSLVDAGVSYGPGLTALGRSGSAEVAVALSEPLAQAPQLVDPTSALEVAYAGELGGAHRFSVRAKTLDQTQQLALQLTAVDLAGNSASAAVAVHVAVDTALPAMPDTLTPGAVLYRRAPFGSRTLGKTTFDVTGQAGSVEGAGTVVVTAPELSNLELARGPSSASGAFGPLALPAIDLVHVAVAFIDQAGNRSPPASVHDTEWTAALAEDDERAGPHRLELEAVALHRWSPPSPNVQTSFASAARPDRRVVAVRAGGYWRQHSFVSPNIAPVAISAPGLGGVIVFSGPQPYLLAPAADYADPWWRPLPLIDPELDGNPAGVSSAAYDEHTRTIVAVTGLKTWVFEGQSWRLVDAASPVVDLLTYDADRGVIVGYGAGTLYLFDGRRWVELGRALLPGAAVSMAYDRNTGRLVTGSKEGESWSLGEPDAGWRRAGMFGDAGSPSEVVWDEASQRVVVRGLGQCDDKAPSATFDTDHWVDVKVSGQSYSCSSTVFDDRLGRLVQLALGSTVGLATFDTSSGWALAPALSSPAPVPSTFQHVLFELNDQLHHSGGMTLFGSSDAGFTVFTGTRWVKTGSLENVSKAVSFAPRSQAGAVPLSRTEVLLGGGFLGGPPTLAPQVFVIDPTGFNAHPYLGAGATRMTYDPLRNQALVRSGLNFDWVAVGLDGGSTATGLSVPTHWAWDSRGYEVGYFGAGTNGYTQTLGRSDTAWVYDDAGVNEMHVSLQDMATEPVTGRALGVTFDSRVFEYQGRSQGWRELAIADPLGNGVPGNRNAASTPLAASKKRGTVFMYGGYLAGTVYGDLWELTTSGTRPALVFRADLRTAAFPPGTRYQRVSIDTEAWGVGSTTDGGNKAAGATLEVWTGRRWQPLGSNAADDEHDAGLSASVIDLAARRMLNRADDLSVRVVTKGVNGAVPAEITLDAVEVTIRATLP